VKPNLKVKIALAALCLFAGLAFFRMSASLPRAGTKGYYETAYRGCVSGVAREDRDLLSGEFGIRAVFIAWQDPFPSQKLNSIADKGSLPMITWEPYLKKSREQSLLPDIASGAYDGLIKAFAAAARKFGKPLLLRWGHEMNGNWYSWSGLQNGHGVYIDAYRRVRGIFREEGADNVYFVFSVNSDDVPSVKSNRFENYYPGADAVDVVGIDAYNWGELKLLRRKGPKRLLRRSYERAVAAFPDKPLMLSEIGSCESGAGKKAWLSEFYSVLAGNFPAIKAFVWFDAKKECDWSVFLDGTTVPADGYYSNSPAALLKLLGEENDKGGPSKTH